MTGIRRRDLLTGTVLLLANGQLAKGEVISGQLPWHPGATAASELFLRPDQTTFTFRNNTSGTALPIRTWGAFVPPNGVGGGGVHWNGETWRFLPSDFVLRTHLKHRYGPRFLPADMTVQDWGVTYEELEPHYDRFECLCGTSGTAGNLRGQIQPGGNPFEGRCGALRLLEVV